MFLAYQIFVFGFSFVGSFCFEQILSSIIYYKNGINHNNQIVNWTLLNLWDKSENGNWKRIIKKNGTVKCTAQLCDSAEMKHFLCAAHRNFKSANMNIQFSSEHFKAKISILTLWTICFSRIQTIRCRIHRRRKNLTISKWTEVFPVGF